MPRIEGRDKHGVCYLGGEKEVATDFVSDRGYRFPACPRCIYSCLGYEMGTVSDGTNSANLIKLENFEQSYSEFVSESGRKIKYLAI